jgi:single-strand DNA-binding protein
MNNANLLGRITSDPELRATANGTKVCSFNLAVNGIKNANGEQRTDFIPITIWNKQAENLCKYVHKGDQLVVSGRIQSNSYEDKDGNKRTKVEVLGNMIQFLGTKKKETTESTFNEDDYEDFNGDVVLSDQDDLPF